MQLRLIELPHARQRRSRALARAARCHARKLERMKGRCAAQLFTLNNLRAWADTHGMWQVDKDADRLYFRLAPIYRDKSTFTLRYYRDGSITVFWRTDLVSGGTASQCSSNDAWFWSWLRHIPATRLLAAANEEGYLQGIGTGTAG